MLLHNYMPQRPGSRSFQSEVDRLRREMNRVFEAPTATVGSEFPPMNVWVSEDDMVVTAEVPGMAPKDIDVSVRGDMLSLRGARSVDPQSDDHPYQRRERVAGTFTRVLHLPVPVDVNRIEATCKDGMLQVTLPRAEADKPTKIAVR